VISEYLPISPRFGMIGKMDIGYSLTGHMDIAHPGAD